MRNYELLIDKLVKSSGLSREDIEGRIGEKKDKLSGLISREGAAQIIAAELGISFEDQDSKIGELMAGLKKVNVVGKIISLFPVREYERDGNKNKVVNFILADETGSTRAVLWDVNHISMIESEEIKQGDVIEIKNGSTRENEIHLSGFSELRKSNLLLEEVKMEMKANEGKLGEARQGQTLKIRGTVVQIFQPRFYSVCPECNKKVVQEGEVFNCNIHGAVVAKDRAILNFVLDDGTDAMRIVMFSDQVNQLIAEEDLKDMEKAMNFRNDFLGTEVYLSGLVKRNQLFNNLEIVANEVERVDVEKLIQELEDLGVSS
jgi:ssDNA-binding replication factor A large subunit